MTHLTISFFHWLLTSIKNGLISLILPVNASPVLCKKRILPGKVKRGIMTFTLVVARSYRSGRKESTVRKGAIVMFNIFNFIRVKSKLELQVEEYVKWKASPEGGNSWYTADDHKKILMEFIKHSHHTSIVGYTGEDIVSYHKKISAEMTPFTVTRVMKAIRIFFRFHKKEAQLSPDQITDYGFIPQRRDVGEKIPEPPIVRPKRGRPRDLLLVKKIKRLRDIEKMPFRLIGIVVKRNVKQVHRMYKYDI